MKKILSICVIIVMVVSMLSINIANAQDPAPQVPTADDFVLTIAVDNTTMPQGEGFMVDIELKNTSGERLEITYCPIRQVTFSSLGLFRTVTARDDWHPFDNPVGTDLPPPITRYFEPGEVIRRSHRIGASFEQGIHELLFEAVFSARFGNGERERLQIVSNTVELTVTRGIFQLTISAQETTVRQGDILMVDIELKNHSAKDFEIIYEILFWPHILSWTPLQGRGRRTAPNLPEPRTRLFLANNTVRNVTLTYEWDNMRGHIFTEHEGKPWVIDTSRLEPGTHELQFSAGFHIQDGETRGGRRVVILSNPITITVLHPQDELPTNDRCVDLPEQPQEPPVDICDHDRRQSLLTRLLQPLLRLFNRIFA